MQSTILISQENVKIRTGLSTPTLWRMRKDGTGPAWAKIGKRVLYDADALEAWIADRMHAVAPTR